MIFFKVHIILLYIFIFLLYIHIIIFIYNQQVLKVCIKTSVSTVLYVKLPISGGQTPYIQSMFILYSQCGLTC